MEWHGYELHPDTPPEGIPLEQKFGPRIHAMQERLLGVARSFGVEGMKPPKTLQSTRKTLAIAEHARDRGKLDEWRETAMRAHWREGADLGDDATLRALASRAGLDPDAAIAASRDAALLARIDERREIAESEGVSGIPTFDAGGFRVVGCQPYEMLEELVRRAGATRKD